jgi:hypothetical protein
MQTMLIIFLIIPSFLTLNSGGIRHQPDFFLAACRKNTRKSQHFCFSGLYIGIL